MRIPIPTVQRQIDPRPANAGPMASGVPVYGVENLGASLFNVGANMQQAANVEADRAAREAAAKLERSEHEQRKNRVMERSRDDRLKWQETMQQRQTEAPEGADGFTSSALKDFDTYREEALKTVSDPEERAMYDGMLGALRESVGEKALVFQAGARTAYRAKSLTEGVEKSARLVTVDPSQMPDVLAQELALIRTSSDLTAEQRATLAERAKDTLSWAATQTLVDRNPDAFLERVGVRGGKPAKDGTPPKQDIEKATAAVQGDAVLSQLPPARLQQAIERATMLSVTRKAALDAERERQARKAEANAERIGREQDRAWLIVSDRLRNGIPTDPSAPELRVLQGSPYAAEYQARIGETAARASVAGLPIDQQQARLDQLKAQQLKGSNKQLDREIEQSQQILDGAKSAYKAEPLRAGADRGIIATPTPLNVSNLDAAIAGMPARVEQAKMVETRTHQAVSPFLAPEADAIANQLQSLGWDERGKRIGQLAAGMTPQQAQAFATQVDPKNRALALELSAGASRTDSGKYVAQWIGRGQQFLKDKPQDGEKASAVRNDIAKYVGESLSGKTREDTIDAAYYAYMGQKDAGLRPSSDGVVSLVLGGPLVEHNGRSIPVPQDIDLPTALRTGAYLAPSGPVFVNGRQIGEAEFRAMLPDAQLEPAGFGRYTVRAGSGLVLDANRKPVRISVIN